MLREKNPRGIQKDFSPMFPDRYHVSCVPQDTFEDHRERSDIFISRLAACVCAMKGPFHDFLTIPSDLSDRQKEEESIRRYIRGYVEKRSRFLDALPPPRIRARPFFLRTI
jgi:hypothetical protein